MGSLEAFDQAAKSAKQVHFAGFMVSWSTSLILDPVLKLKLPVSVSEEREHWKAGRGGRH